MNSNKKIYFLKFKKLMDRLNIKFLTITERVLIPNVIQSKKKNRLCSYFLQKIYGKYTDSISKKICVFLLKKYHYFPKIIDMLPLTKFIHINFKFKKHRFKNNKKFFHIKIKYIFATPLLINNLKSLKKNISSYLKKNNNKYPFNLLTDASKLISQSQITTVTTKKFLQLVLPKYKYGTSVQLVNVPKQPKTKYIFDNSQFIMFNDMAYTYDTEDPKWHRTIYKQTPLCRTFCPQDPEYYKDPILPEPQYSETFPTKFLILNSLEFPTSFTKENLLFTIIYNYMLLNNIYLNEKKEFIQITQTHSLKTYVVNSLIKYGKLKDLPIYESMLINKLPIHEQLFSTSTNILEKLPTMIAFVCNILNIYGNPEKIFRILGLCTIHSSGFLIITEEVEKQKQNREQLVKSLENYITQNSFLSKTELLKIKAYNESSEYLDTWYELVALACFVGVTEDADASKILSEFETATYQEYDCLYGLTSINIYL